MSTLTNTRKAVATMANALRKQGYTLSEAFKKAWRRVKATMTFRAVGVTFDKRQDALRWFGQYKGVTVTLQREPNNPYDANAIRIDLHYGRFWDAIGYVNRNLAEALAKVMDKGIEVKAELVSIIGGYNDRSTLGALINVSV